MLSCEYKDDTTVRVHYLFDKDIFSFWKYHITMDFLNQAVSMWWKFRQSAFIQGFLHTFCINCLELLRLVHPFYTQRLKRNWTVDWPVVSWPSEACSIVFWGQRNLWALYLWLSTVILNMRSMQVKEPMVWLKNKNKPFRKMAKTLSGQVNSLVHYLKNESSCQLSSTKRLERQ